MITVPSLIIENLEQNGTNPRVVNPFLKSPPIFRNHSLLPSQFPVSRFQFLVSSFSFPVSRFSFFGCTDFLARAVLNSIVGTSFHTGAALNTLICIWSSGFIIYQLIDFCGAHFHTLTAASAEVVVYADGASDFFTFPCFYIRHFCHLLHFTYLPLYKFFG